MFQPVETALSASWPKSNIPFHVSSSSPILPKLTMGNVNKLGFGDWINPFRRARSHEDNLSITGQIQTRMLEREWHFNARLSLKQSHTSTEDTSEWNMREWAEQKRGLIYLLCVILHRSHYQLFVMDAYFLLQWKMAIGAVWYCKIGTYNVLQSKTKAHLQCFQALNLIFLCANLACLHVCGESWRKACWYAGDTGKQRYGGARYRCCIDAMRSTVVKSIWPPSMRDRSREQKRGERLRGGKVDIDQMHVQTNSCQAQHTKNNVAWATLAPRVWCLPSEFFWVRHNIWRKWRHIMIIILLFQCSHGWSYC